MTGFLASIKNMEEASKITASNIDIVDLKNINDGALGFVGVETVNKVKKILPNFNLSVTMGNDENPNNSINIENLRELIDNNIKFVKIGFFNKKFINQHKLLLNSINFKSTLPICVIFADKTFDLKIIQELIDIGYEGVMIDTCNKNNKSTTEILGENQIKSFIKIVKDNKKLCGLSGSLKIKDIDYLKDLNPHFLGFRGQLCDKTSERIELNIDLLNKVSKEIKSIINA